MLVDILNQLFEYSRCYINVRQDNQLPIPAFSMIEKDMYGRYTPVILINRYIFPDNKDVLAHVLSHEWGHHMLKHMLLDPPSIENMPKKDEIQLHEDQADTYAAEFIHIYKYDKKPIIEFMRDHPNDLQNRLDILNQINLF